MTNIIQKMTGCAQNLLGISNDGSGHNTTNQSTQVAGIQDPDNTNNATGSSMENEGESSGSNSRPPENTVNSSTADSRSTEIPGNSANVMNNEAVQQQYNVSLLNSECTETADGLVVKTALLISPAPRLTNIRVEYDIPIPMQPGSSAGADPPIIHSPTVADLNLDPDERITPRKYIEYAFQHLPEAVNGLEFGEITAYVANKSKNGSIGKELKKMHGLKILNKQRKKYFMKAEN